MLTTPSLPGGGPGRMTRRLAVLVFVLLAAGCSSGRSSGDDSTAVEGQVQSGFADQRNVIVHATDCATGGDTNHYSCTVSYETAEGMSASATVLVTCDSSRCVWREQ